MNRTTRIRIAQKSFAESQTRLEEIESELAEALKAYEKAKVRLESSLYAHQAKVINSTSFYAARLEAHRDTVNAVVMKLNRGRPYNEIFTLDEHEWARTSGAIEIVKIDEAVVVFRGKEPRSEKTKLYSVETDFLHLSCREVASRARRQFRAAEAERKDRQREARRRDLLKQLTDLDSEEKAKEAAHRKEVAKREELRRRTKLQLEKITSH